MFWASVQFCIGCQGSSFSSSLPLPAQAGPLFLSVGQPCWQNEG